VDRRLVALLVVGSAQRLAINGTSAAMPVIDATQATKQRWNASASSVARISPR
jgi:hypothetical protein